MKDDSNFSTILHNPHFCKLAALLSVPYTSTEWRLEHPKVPFWMLHRNIARLLNDACFASQPTRTEFIGHFVSMLVSLVEADERLHYSPDEMEWFVKVMDGNEALVTMAMLFACASSQQNYLTPVQLAEQTGKSESYWRKRAETGEIIGTIKLGKQWLIPLLSLRAEGINISPKEDNQEKRKDGLN